MTDKDPITKDAIELMIIRENQAQDERIERIYIKKDALNKLMEQNIWIKAVKYVTVFLLITMVGIAVSKFFAPLVTP